MPIETTTDEVRRSLYPDRVYATAPLHPSSLADRIAGLRNLTQLDGLTEDEFAWIASHCTERIAPDGAAIFVENEPSHHTHFFLKGEVHVHRRNTGSASLFIGRAAPITGKLPFSRMKTWGGDGFAFGSFWSLDLHEDLFPAMLLAIPSMAQRTVSMLLDRVREFTRSDEQTAKLIALGKLAANLAHELNNPASAAQRAAATLAVSLAEEDDAKYYLGYLCKSEDELDAYRAWIVQAREWISSNTLNPPPASAALATTDREDQIVAWLEARRIPDAWQIAPALAESALPITMLDSLAATVSPALLPLGVTNFATLIRSARAARTIIGSTNRIFEIIAAIKDYSYMDQVPLQDVDLALSLDRTLAMFQSRLANVTIKREFDSALPPIRAYGSELNQVWTAIIENALDAMQDRGILSLATRLKAQFAFIEIRDDGPGIDPALQARIFEPFFTTKPVGTALGLGLDGVQRIVGKHFGSVSVESTSASTCFQVRLPIDRTLIY